MNGNKKTTEMKDTKGSFTLKIKNDRLTVTVTPQSGVTSKRIWVYRKVE